MKETLELKDLHWNVNRTEAGSMLSSLGTEIEPLRDSAREGREEGIQAGGDTCTYGRLVLMYSKTHHNISQHNYPPSKIN